MIIIFIKITNANITVYVYPLARFVYVLPFISIQSRYVYNILNSFQNEREVSPYF